MESRVTFDATSLPGSPIDAPVVVPAGSRAVDDTLKHVKLTKPADPPKSPDKLENSTGITPSDDATQLVAYRFCRSVVSYLICGCVAVAVLNFVVNPYAQYSVEFFQPVVQKSRAAKVRLLKSLPSQPGGLILGSSRVLKIEPDYLTQLTGQTFFNAGMNYGRVEDMLAYLRFYEAHYGSSPQCLVIGLDVAAFSDQAKVDPRLLNEPDLIRQLPEISQLPGRFERWQDLLSWQQTTHSARCLLKTLRHACEPDREESYRADGLLQYHEREARIAAGTYDFQAALDYNKHEYTQLLTEFKQISPERLALWETLAKHCQEKRIQLAVFLTPSHPELARELEAKTRYPMFHDELRRELERLSDVTGYHFVDLSDIATFHGEASQFVDGIHPLESNTRRMMNRLWQR